MPYTSLDTFSYQRYWFATPWQHQTFFTLHLQLLPGSQPHHALRPGIFSKTLLARSWPPRAPEWRFIRMLSPALLVSPSTQPVLNQKPIIYFPEIRRSVFKSPSTKADPICTYWAGFNSPVSLPLPSSTAAGPTRRGPHSCWPTGQPSSHTPFPRALKMKSRCLRTISRLLLKCSILPIEGTGRRERCCI